MSLGPGKYDTECTAARLAANAEGVLLIVVNGDRGHGFAVQSTARVLADIPQMLRTIANDIEQDGERV